MSIIWNTGLAAERARANLRLEKKKTAPGPKATSYKPQASSRLKEDTIMN